MNENKKYLALLGTIIVQFTLGSIYAWSLFNHPLAVENNWPLAKVIVTFSITSISLAIGTLFAAKFKEVLGLRKTLVVCGIGIGSGLIIAAGTTSLTVLYIFAGFVVGFSNGVAYLNSLSNCIAWFPNNKGVASGITISAYGLGALVFKFIHIYVLNNFGIDAAFYVWGIIVILFVSIGSTMIDNAPNVVIANNNSNIKDYTRLEVLKTPQAYLLFIALLTSCMGGIYIISAAADIGEDMAGLSISAAANAVIMIAIANTLGRLVLGSLSDKFGYSKTSAMSFALIIVSTAILAFTKLDYLSFLLSVGGIAFAFGGNLSIFPVIVGKYYGLKNNNKNYCLIYQSFGISAIIGGQVALLMGGLKPTFVLIFALAIISFFIMYFIKDPQSK